MALRYAVNLLLLVGFYAPKQGLSLLKTNRTALVLVRAACLSAASLTMGIAWRYMPVGETVAIIYISPIIVTVLAIPFLGEMVPLIGGISAGVGFFGVLLIMRPGAGLHPTGVALALVYAGFAAAYALLSRILAKTETTPALLFYTALVGVLAFGGALLWNGLGPLPVGIDWLHLLALGALATIGHVLFTSTHKEAPASLLAPVNYMHLVWAGILGWLVFGHTPDALSMVGMGLVAAAGVAVALRSQLAKP